MSFQSIDRAHLIKQFLRRGGAAGPVVLILLFLVAGALGIFLVIWDGQAGQAQINANPPAGSVEGNLAQQAIWAASPIKGYIAKNKGVPSDEEGAKLLDTLRKRPPPTFYPPTPAGTGNPTYRKTNNGFEIIFPGTDGKPVVCSFSSEGAYEGATGLGAFTSQEDSVKNPLEGTTQ